MQIQTKMFEISNDAPTYFIADIAANHDGSLARAKELIRLASASGANAAKFQNFRAETIVSSRGFRELGQALAHQAAWTEDVVTVYQKASLPWEWTEELSYTCEEFGIDYFTSPYDLLFLDSFSHLLPIIKIGSGDITWDQLLLKCAEMSKPVFLATGASSLKEVKYAVELLAKSSCPIVIMQCNTNYTGSLDNFHYLNLKVLETFKVEFPGFLLGLSDHTPGYTSVLGAVALGARVVEKHFTDDSSRFGPDHGFSLTPNEWRKMVDETRKLEAALGDGIKRVEKNEVASQIVQRRSLRYAHSFSSGYKIKAEDLIALRPCPTGALTPSNVDLILGKILIRDVDKDSQVAIEDFASS